MKMTLSPRLLTITAAVATTLLAACSSTGNDAGDTNVEQGTDKRNAPITTQGSTASDSVTSGTASDTAAGPTVREQYDQAGQAKDRNHDKLAD